LWSDRPCGLQRAILQLVQHLEDPVMRGMKQERVLKPDHRISPATSPRSMRSQSLCVNSLAPPRSGDLALRAVTLCERAGSGLRLRLY